MRRPIVNYRCAVQPGDGPVPYACPPTAHTVHCCRATELGNTPRTETSQGAPGGSGLADPSSDDDLFHVLRTATHFQPCARWVVLASLVAARALGQAPTSVTTIQERLGYPRDARLLVIHADDAGMAHSVNRATLEALEQGWITSASILVVCPWFPEVARWARAHLDADLGIHLALNSEWTPFRWGPVSPVDKVSSLLDDEGYLPLVEETVLAKARPKEAERELRSQIDRALAAGIRITHLDAHMGTVGGTPALIEVYRRLGRKYEVPVLLDRGRQYPPGAEIPDAEVLVDRILEMTPGVPVTEWQAAYERMLAPLPPGVYQLIVHLAWDDEEMRGATWDHPDWGAAWRQADLDLVKSESFRNFLSQQGFVRVGWKDLAKARAVQR